MPLPSELGMDKADNQILGLALMLKKEQPRACDSPFYQDANLRIKSDALGIIAEDYEPSNVEPDQLYSGECTIKVDPQWWWMSFMQISDCRITKNFLNTIKTRLKHLFPNQYVILKDYVNPTHTAMGRYSKELDAIVPLVKPPEGLWGIFPKNAEQAFAVDALIE